MRLLFIALGILLLVLGLNTWASEALGRVDGVPRPAVVPQGKALDLQAIGSGPGLAAVMVGDAAEPAGIWVGDRRFNAPAGLTAVVIDRHRRILTSQIVDPRTTPRAEQMWERLLQDVPDPGLLIIASNGPWCPIDPASQQTWSVGFARIGARATAVTESSGVALVVERRGGQWEVVGERVGRGQSARLDLRVPASWPDSALPQVGRLEQTEMPLAIVPPTVPPIEGLSEFRSGYGIPALGMTLAGWNMHPPFDKFLAAHPDGANRMGWSVHLGAHPRFSAWVRHDGIPVGSDGGIFQVRVNDEMVFSRFVGPESGSSPVTPVTAIPVSVDLSQWANKTVELTIHTMPHQNTACDWMHWIGMRLDERGDLEPVAPKPSRLRLIGHAYPMTGDDKTRRAYLGVPGDRLLAEGSPFRGRVSSERDHAVFSSWCAALSATRAARVVWLGDLAYGPDAPEIEAVNRMLERVAGPHVWVPGNHDLGLFSSSSFLAHLRHWGRGSEMVHGVRVTYVDTSTPAEGETVDVSDATCRPNQVWIDRTIARITQDGSSRHQIILMHHAPWLTLPGTANVAHDPASNWWITVVHPKLVAHAQATGQRLWLVAGDAGDHVAATGVAWEGIQYLVTGLPRRDSEVPMAWLEVAWDDPTAALTWEVHTWDPLKNSTVEIVTVPFRK